MSFREEAVRGYLVPILEFINGDNSLEASKLAKFYLDQLKELFGLTDEQIASWI